MENCTRDNTTLQDGIVLFQLIVYVPVFCLGIPLNMIAFWVFCYKIKRWTETRVYLINLMVADSFLLFALPFLIYFTKYEYPIDNLCFTILNIYFVNMPMSIFIITLIAIDRYIAIKFPLKAKILRSPLKSASRALIYPSWILDQPSVPMSDFQASGNRELKTVLEHRKEVTHGETWAERGVSAKA
ncbi:PREDICTED: G-protein coupled receptor 35-like [Eurypyga helias]|uniref:G-protein coupled receptor 35-like n=1 Tax=Eurypyga helias TaxID=54383 RepID=UPI00052807C5|nr:PREDICTED: G-protein coupled receptor 35-like [Eurypyga helias]